MTADPPGHQQVAPLRLGRLPLRDDGHRRAVCRHAVAGLHQQSSAQAADVVGGGAVRTVQDQDAEALAARQAGGGLLVHCWADDDLEERLGQFLGGGQIERAVQGHDAAVGRSRVAGVGAAVRVERGVAGREPARVGVLDHGGSRFSELGDQVGRRVGVQPVGEGEGGSLQVAGVGDPTRDSRHRIESSPLMGILPVAELGDQRSTGGEVAPHRPIRGFAGEPVGDRGVVGGHMGKRLGGKPRPGGRAHRPRLLDLRQNLGVLGGRHDDGHRAAVLRGRPDHGGPADVDVLDHRLPVGAGGDGGGKRVEADHHQIDRRVAVLLQSPHVLREIAAGEDARVNGRMEGLDPAVQHLGCAGDLADLAHRDAGISEGLGSATGRDQLHPGLVEPTGEVCEARLVADADEGSHVRESA